MPLIRYDGTVEHIMKWDLLEAINEIINWDYWVSAGLGFDLIVRDVKLSKWQALLIIQW